MSPTSIAEINPLLKKWVKEALYETTDVPVRKENIDEYYLVISNEIDEVLEQGSNLWYCLEKSLDSASPVLWSEMESMGLEDLLGYAQPFSVTGAEFLAWDDCGPEENLRRNYVVYLSSYYIHVVREKWEDEFGVDPANTEIVLTA